MAISTSGIDSLAAEFKDLSEVDKNELTEKMLKAGAEVITDEWKRGIKQVVKHDGRSTGEMLESVAPSKKITHKGDVSSIAVYPQGKDRKGVKNAEKAYILHYGKSGQMGTRFVDEIESSAESKAFEAMEKILNDFTGGK